MSPAMLVKVARYVFPNHTDHAIHSDHLDNLGKLHLNYLYMSTPTIHYILSDNSDVQTIQTMPFTQIIAFKSYLDNLGKPLKSTLTTYICQLQPYITFCQTTQMYILLPQLGVCFHG